MAIRLRDVQIDKNKDDMTESFEFKELRRLKKVAIYANHRGTKGSKHPAG